MYFSDRDNCSHALSYAQLYAIAYTFIDERSWWEFHNPKSDAMNVIVEAGELAELCAPYQDFDLRKNAATQEMADIFFALFCCMIVSKVSLQDVIGAATNAQAHESMLYEECTAHIVHACASKPISTLQAIPDIVLALIGHASQLGDIFVWTMPEDVDARAQDHHASIIINCANILQHLIYLSHRLEINLADIYMQKMKKNSIKYPVASASGKGYERIKDSSRGRI